MVPVLVPREAEKTTTSPPVVRLLPAASRVRSVSVEVPPETMVELETETCDVVVDAGPGSTAIDSDPDVTGFPSMVAPIVVGVPARTPVNVAV